ncbi:MAG TPA: ABC transporter ATP-binding protein [Candidatus Limiplasma sp.]|nr:ABC transporter ATP-binding protein [Candidatus Limiplasma sp.]
MAQRILEVNNLEYSFDTYAGQVQAVRRVTFHVNAGETLAIVGKSGCGKTVSVQAILKLLPEPPGRMVGGSIRYLGEEISQYNPKKMSRLRGKEMSIIFQDPMTSLNPTMRIGKQIIEGIRKHERISRREGRARAVEMLGKVGIPSPERNMNRYPHQFSGGMRQRVMIAMALACKPRILFADEPTTALDVTTQAQILELMHELKQELNASVVIITHDLSVVARVSQRIAVMYAGKIVETGDVRDIFYNPRHPYTWGLLQSVPHREGDRRQELTAIPGTPPDLFHPPAGCGFAFRCRYCMGACTQAEPPQTDLGNGHLVSCWLLDERAPKTETPQLAQRKGVREHG